MSLKGKAAIAIWHDLTDEGTEEFYEWHGREHMPERMAIPGFNRGRRYIVLGQGPRYFNLYEADDMAVLAGPDYLERLNNPTDWTRRAVAAFRDVARSACDVRYSEGVGQGGFLATVRFEAPDALDAAAACLARIGSRFGISAVHLLADDAGTSRIKTRERAARGEAAKVPPHIVLIEGIGEVQVADAAAAFRIEFARCSDAPVETALYALQHAIDGEER